MNILNKIEISESSGAVALFFYNVKPVEDFDAARGEIRTKSVKIKQRHCEIFTKKALIGAGLNENSFVLRFNDRHQKHPRSLLLTLNDSGQVSELADLLQFCLGLGLKVKEHYANISIKQTLQKKS